MAEPRVCWIVKRWRITRTLRSGCQTAWSQGQYKFLATPYSGKEVSWIDWHEDNRQAATSKKTRWCEAPWHPVRVSKLPGTQGGGIAVACLDDRKVVAVSDADLLATPRVLASFAAIARQARPSPSGHWLYVSLE